MTSGASNLEAMLFITGEAVQLDDAAEALGIPRAALDEIIAELTGHLAESGLTLLKTATEVQLTTAPAVAEFLSSFVEDEEISRAASETLAIIAYRGPVSRYDIDVIRGVDSGRMVRQLLTRGLIDKQRGSNRAPLYDITPEFLQHLGIVARQELPDYTQLSSDENLRLLLEQKSQPL